MSVYTLVGHDELAGWLTPLGVGELRALTGIAAGMQNSNYFVDAAAGRHVLTLFERVEPADLDFYLALMDHLARRGIPCPRPLADGEGRLWRLLAGKPAALFTCLPGAWTTSPSLAQIETLGATLARLHLAGSDFPSPLPNPCGTGWCQRLAGELLPRLRVDEQELLVDELAFLAAQDFAALPRGVIHADLFRDNVLWTGAGDLSGVLDFYFAGEDVLLLDLAIVANDWCSDDAALAALLAGYVAVRPLTAAEYAAWPALCRLAALRFWLLRLEVRERPRAGDVVTIKNPDDFATLLRRFRLAPPALPR